MPNQTQIYPISCYLAALHQTSNVLNGLWYEQGSSRVTYPNESSRIIPGLLYVVVAVVIDQSASQHVFVLEVTRQEI